MYWTKELDCIAFGPINLINHSSKIQNISIEEDYTNMTKKIYAKRDIKKGEELLMNYDCDFDFGEK